MLYSCTRMATVDVKGLNDDVVPLLVRLSVTDRSRLDVRCLMRTYRFVDAELCVDRRIFTETSQTQVDVDVSPFTDVNAVSYTRYHGVLKIAREATAQTCGLRALT